LSDGSETGAVGSFLPPLLPICLIRLSLVQKLFDVHLDLAIWTFGNIFFWDVNYLRSFTFGTFDLDGFPFVSHGWFLLLLDLLPQSGGENKEETAWGLRIADCGFKIFSILTF